MKKNGSSARRRHEGRDDLAGEHRCGDMGQIILLIIFLAVWITDCFLFNYSSFLSKYIPLYIKIPLGSVLLLVSGYTAKSGLKIVFDEVRDEPCVIRKGIFGIVRHPIYLGSILFYLALLAFALSISAAIVWVIVIAFYHFIARHEEKLLLSKFGDAYSEYINEVPMWLPRIGRR